LRGCKLAATGKAMASPDDGKKRAAGPALAVLAVVLAIPLVIFLPLFLAGIEQACFGTHHVENFFHEIGLHGVLDAIYDPVIDFLRNVGIGF
jgi:hypothetical protein